MSGDTPSHTSAIPDSTPPLGWNSAHTSELHSAHKSELCSTLLGQLSDLHAQIDELKDALHDAKKSYCNAKAALMKEHSQVKDLEQELKDLKSCSQIKANASTLLPTTLATVEPNYRWSYPHGPCHNQRQGHHDCPRQGQRPGPLAYPCLRRR